jgi:hypothetical protein
MGHDVVGTKPKPPKLKIKERTTTKLFGVLPLTDTTHQQEITPPPIKHTTEETKEGQVHVNPAQPSVGVAAKKTTKKDMEFKPTDQSSDPPPSTNTGTSNQSTLPTNQ